MLRQVGHEGGYELQRGNGHHHDQQPRGRGGLQRRDGCDAGAVVPATSSAVQTPAPATTTRVHDGDCGTVPSTAVEAKQTTVPVMAARPATAIGRPPSGDRRAVVDVTARMCARSTADSSGRPVVTCSMGSVRGSKR